MTDTRDTDAMGPTARLRLVERDVEVPWNPPAGPGLHSISEVRRLRILQQQFKHLQTGETEWRDVPLEGE